MGHLQNKFYAILKERYPMMAGGVEEARRVSPDMVDQYFERCLAWVTASYGEEVLGTMADSYAGYTFEVNRSQQAYEKAGKYQVSSFAEANELVYQQSDYMQHYYWAVFGILFCWSHYVELMEFYLERFVKRLSPGLLLEVAPGHGAWGALALTQVPGMTLEGLDISPTSLELAPRMAVGAGVGERCIYRVADATQVSHGQGRFDAAICCFMLEHLEQPAEFLAGLAPALKPGALAFVTLALTAAQTDHIYEFRLESEAIVMAEKAGFELLECRVARPRRLIPKARFVPRVQALLLRRL